MRRLSISSSTKGIRRSKAEFDWLKSEKRGKMFTDTVLHDFGHCSDIFLFRQAPLKRVKLVEVWERFFGQFFEDELALRFCVDLMTSP